MAPIFLVMMVPLIVYGKLFVADMGGAAWFPDNSENLDIFLYYKKNAIILLSVLMLFIITVRIFHGDFPMKNPIWKQLAVFFPFAVYVALAFLSSFISPYKAYAWKGIMEQFESIWVISGYFIICIYTYICYNESFLPLFAFGCGAIGAIGTLQFFGADIYRTEWFRKLCMPAKLQKLTFQITAERGRVYCSLSNPNYVGMLCCLAVPVLTVLAVSEKKRLAKMLYGVSDALVVCALIGSRSKSGIAALAFCMVLLLLIFRRQIEEQFKQSFRHIVVLAGGALLAVGMLAALVWYQWDYFSESIHSMVDSTYQPDTKISKVSTGNKGVEIVYNGKTLFFGIDYEKDTLQNALHVVNENGEAYAAAADEQGVLRFKDEALSQLTVALVKYGDYIAMELWDGAFYWYFTDQAGNHTWYYLTNYGKPDKFVSDEIRVWKGLEGKERILSGRGYIWSRTIPLLKRYFLVGSGQDSFALAFPNNDYLGMARWGYKDMLITKPHCMYMQIAIQSGVLSLLFLFLFWAWYFIRVVRLKKRSTQLDCSKAKAIAVAIGILGYLLTGLANDSNIGVAPLFWMLLGAGIKLGSYQ